MKRTILLSLAFSCCLAMSAQKYTDYENSYDFKHGLELLMGQDEPDENGALESLNKELQAHPKNGYAYYYIGLVRYNNDENGMALAACSKAIDLLKKDKEWISFAYRLRAKVYLKLDDDAKAQNDWKASLKINPTDENTLIDRAEYYYQKNEIRLSDAEYDLLIKAHPDSDVGYLGKGRNAKTEKRFQDAVNLLDYAIKLNPNRAKNYTFRAQAYMGLKKYAEAADDLIKALAAEKGNDDAYYILQDWKEPEMNVLIAKLKIEAAKDKTDSKWPFYMGVVYEANGKFVKAIDAYTKANGISAGDALLGKISDCYSELGDYDLALDYIDQALTADSTYEGYVMSKADILYEMGRTKEAISECGKFIDMRPDYAGGYYRRGFMKDNIHDVDGAMEDYSTSIMLDSTYAYAYLGRADMYMMKGDKAAAETDYRMVIKLDTIYGESNTAHYAYLALGMKDKAIAFMDSVLAHSDSKGNLYDAACLYARMGEKMKAVKFLNRSLDKGFRRFVHIANDDDLDGLRDMAEFVEVVSQFKNKAKADEKKQKEELGIKDNLQEYTCEIPFTTENGNCYVKCKVNGLPLRFTFDTGASDVSLSMVEANFMMKNGYMSKGDIVGKGYYSDATGSVSEGTIVNLRKVEFGDLSLDNVRASIVKNQKAPLLLGQTVLSRAGKIEIDNNRKVLTVKYKK